MPYLPTTGTDGNVFDVVHASRQDAAISYQDALSHNHLDVRNIGSAQGFNASMILKLSQQHTSQVLVTCTSSVSLLAAVCAVYWFWMMRRNFRRDLVLLLILGGSWKSLWFMIFSAATFTQGKIATETAFCQASGYMLQVGFEMCDLAVLFMSMHMYLQIFPPTRFTFIGHDGLYRVRHWVWGAWFILPNMSAALAFIGMGYMAQGGFCSLPLRPMWYRLALFWIPRYMIWIYVIFVAISITRYVGNEFKVFGQEKDSSTSQALATFTGDTGATAGTNLQKASTRTSTQKTLDLNDDDMDSCAPDDVESIIRTKPRKISPQEFAKSQQANALRRESMPAWALGTETSDAASNPFTSHSKSLPTSRRGSRQINHGVLFEDFGLPPGLDASTNRGSIASMNSGHSSAGVSCDAPPTLAPIAENLPSAAKSNVPHHSANRALRFRRAAIQRQLRLLFIYPCVYLLLWVIPFVVNCMNYIDYWAQHPIFPLKVIQLTCMTIMTFVDVFIFCWRETPWRHIPGSDGTFWGSFMFWRFCFGGTWAQRRRTSRAPSNVPDLDGSRVGKSGSRTGLLASLMFWTRRSSARSSDADGSEAAGRPRMPHKRTHSGGSDRRHLEAERAAERLAMERAEYEGNRCSLQERRTSVISQSQQAPPAAKNWFDAKDQDLLEENDDLNYEKRGSIAWGGA